MVKNSNLIIIALSMLLIASVAYNVVQMNKLSGAESLSGKLTNYLSLAHKQCPAESSDFKGMSSCMDNLTEKLQEKPILVEAMFVNYYLSTVQSKGVLIFKNIGTTTFDSSKFKLYLNTEIQDNDGCEKTGQVPPESLCSLNFKKVCSPGDVLNVEYDRKVIMVKSC